MGKINNMNRDNKFSQFDGRDEKLPPSDVSGSYTHEWEALLDQFRKTEWYRKSRGQLLFPKFFEWLSSNYEIPKRKSL
jgi:hypothetical protein